MSYGRSPSERIIDRTREAPNVPTLSRHDWAIVDIPLAYVTALLATTVWSVSLLSTLVVAALLQFLVLADVLFWHPPAPGTE